jgi:glycosyltransferase 2 family protein
MSQGKRKKWVLAAEMVLAIGIVVCVVWYFANALSKLPPVQFTVRYEWLVPAGLLYLLAHLCWAIFWVRLLHNQNVNVPWWIGIRTYYISQFGKYVPGKIAVVAMRMGILHRFGGRPVTVGVTAVYETFTSMSAGALLAVLFLPALGVLPPEISKGRVALFAMFALPLGLGLLNKLVARIAKKRRGPDAEPLPAPSLWLLIQGLLHGAMGYCFLALSLGCTISAILPNPPEYNADFVAVTFAAVALSYVAGFVILVAPGGLGAREFVLVAALTPPFALALAVNTDEAAGMAIIVALVLRLTWTTAEVAIGALLYVKKPKLPSIPHTPSIPIHHETPHGKPHA